MNVLIACEESQAVCRAFLSRGHNVYSCDLQECSGGMPDRHIIGDCLRVIFNRCFETQDGLFHQVSEWDFIIAHPPCTYLSNAGNRSLYLPDGSINNERYEKGMAAKEFFMILYNVDVPRVVIENPIPNPRYGLPKYSQIVCPSQFGEDYKKRTCLWERGVPPLIQGCRTLNADSTDTAEWFQKHHSDKDRQKNRSKTSIRLAQAMAEQWG